MDVHRAQRVDLLGHSHGADLCGHRRADPPGKHQRGDGWAEFAEHRHAHKGTATGFHAEGFELK